MKKSQLQNIIKEEIQSIMLTDKEIELRDAYLKGYDDALKPKGRLWKLDRYELADRYAKQQNK